MPAELDHAQIASLARAFRLNWGRIPLAGRVGEKLGSRAGASTEFHDYRAYVPGDDIRHIDWKAFARSDTLTLRLFREEITPRVDCIVDETRSMAITEEKWARLRELVLLFGLVARAARAHLRIAGSGAPRTVHDPLRHEHACVERADPWPDLAGTLRWRSVRIAISDFLFPHDPAALVRTLARDAGCLAIVQLNTPAEIDPDFRGPFRLIDVDDGTRIDLQVGAPAVERYKRRFSRLREDLEREAVRAHARYVSLSTALDLRTTAKELVRAAVLEVS